MGFVVDKVSEDSFYENLLLGLSKVLERSPCVSKVTLKRIPGVRQADIRAWEHNNGVILPEDLRSFYSSCNGFLLTYEFSYDYKTTNEEERDYRTGIIQVNAINDVIRVYGYETKNNANVEHCGKRHSLTLSRESKVFELANVDENAKVVLVYPTTYSIPNIWFYWGQMSFSFLAEDFTTYFRMTVAHLGIPYWQYAFSKENLPETSREMFTIIAPGILAEDRNLVERHKYDLDNVNKIDPNIFSPSQGGSQGTNLERNVNVRSTENKTKERIKSKSVPKKGTSAKNRKH
ncbi:tubulin polyglutamylase complex subunit 2 isoform X2 [Rhynchophorus ferrugineus]|uniref:Knr4/Smi1-like domain-containing protein n=1 Tax=Rhynchophorus ferrugineus TaxID=354439 RepID=A0A834I770_RHYFE|nr:hypothetical protein GWI33_011264 [Rhynchophorus ferrugineus]